MVWAGRDSALGVGVGLLGEVLLGWFVVAGMGCGRGSGSGELLL